MQTTITLTSDAYLKQINNIYYYSLDFNNTDDNINGWYKFDSSLSIINGKSSQMEYVIVHFITEFTLTDDTRFYIYINSDYITIDGNNYTINLSNVYGWGGLISNGDSRNNGYSNIIVQNFIISNSGGNLLPTSGYLFSSFFGNLTSGPIRVTNCIHNGNIDEEGG